MSDTPKTDKNIFTCIGGDYSEEVVKADFARELERENIRLKAQLNYASLHAYMMRLPKQS